MEQFVDASDVDIANAKSPSKASASKTSWSGAVVQTVDIPANSTATVTFALSWYFPNRMRETSVGANYTTRFYRVVWVIRTWCSSAKRESTH